MTIVDKHPWDNFTDKEKKSVFSSSEYEEAYHKWIKSGLYNLNDFEKWQIMHGRSFRETHRSLRMPNSWINNLIKNLQSKFPNLPEFKYPSRDMSYRREKVYFPVAVDNLKDGSIDFQNLMLEMVSNEFSDLIHESKSVDINIYITRGIYLMPADIEFFVIWFDFEI